MPATLTPARRLADRLKLPVKVARHALTNRPWTEAEDDTLRREYGRTPAAALADRLDRTPAAVGHRAAVLGLPPKRATEHRDWTEAEERQLVEWWGTVGHREIAAKLGRTVPGVRAKGGALGLRTPRAAYARKPRPFAPPWSEGDTAALRVEYATADDLPALAARLGRTVAAVVLKANSIGLTRREFRKSPMPSAEVVRALHEAGWSDTRMAAELGTTQVRVSHVRRSLGLAAHYGFEPGWGRRTA